MYPFPFSYWGTSVLHTDIELAEDGLLTSRVTLTAINRVVDKLIHDSVVGAETPSVSKTELAPAAPSGLAVSIVSSSRLDLAWTDNSSFEDGIEIWHSTDGSTFTLLTQVGANTESYSHTGLGEATLHYYKVRSTNGTAASAFSNTDSARTSTVVPAAPTGCAFTRVLPNPSDQSTWINRITWNDNSTNETHFRVKRSHNGGSFATLSSTVSANSESYDDPTVVENDTYAYEVEARRVINGQSAYSSASTSSTLRAFLEAPSGLVATAQDSNSVSLNWTDNSLVGDKARIYRNGVQIAEIDAALTGTGSYTDNSAPVDSAIEYEVRAYLLSNGNLSQAGATTDIVETPAAPPSNVTASAVSHCVGGATDADAIVSWNNGAASSGWTTRVEFSTSPPGDSGSIGGIPLSQTSLTRNAFGPGIEYTFQVRHEHTDGRTTDWVTASVTTVSANCPPTPTIGLTDESHCIGGTIDECRYQVTWPEISGWCFQAHVKINGVSHIHGQFDSYCYPRDSYSNAQETVPGDTVTVKGRYCKSDGSDTGAWGPSKTITMHDCVGNPGIVATDISYCDSTGAHDRVAYDYNMKSGWDVHVQHAVNGGSWLFVYDDTRGSSGGHVETGKDIFLGCTVQGRARYQRTGETDNYDTSSVISIDIDCPPSAPPSSLSATNNSHCLGTTAVYQIECTWTNGDSSASTEFQYSVNSGTTWSLLGTASPGVTNKVFSAPNGVDGYAVRCRHFNNHGGTDWSNSDAVFITTLDCGGDTTTTSTPTEGG